MQRIHQHLSLSVTGIRQADFILRQIFPLIDILGSSPSQGKGNLLPESCFIQPLRQTVPSDLQGRLGKICVV